MFLSKLEGIPFPKEIQILKIDSLAAQRDEWNKMRINHQAAWSHRGVDVRGYIVCSTWDMPGGCGGDLVCLGVVRKIAECVLQITSVHGWMSLQAKMLQNWQMESSRIINSGRIGYIVTAQLKCKRLYILPFKCLFTVIEEMFFVHFIHFYKQT